MSDEHPFGFYVGVHHVCDWHLVDISQEIFGTFDKDRSGTMDMYELRKALEKQGIIASATVFGF